MTRLTRRRALLIGNEQYDDSRFGLLPSTQVDTWQLQQVLQNRNIGNFTSVRRLADLTADDMRFEISEFLGGCEEDELALLYVSGHGTRLVQAGGEFHFVARDTDFDRVATTGVSASFVNERLESCWAPQKVALIDCCQSGGFAVGLRTSDGPAQPAAKSGGGALLTSRGVYVMSSSRAGEDSYAGAETPDGVEPSAFTGQVVEALRTGKVGKDGTGEVTVDDLFQYVNRRMRADNPRQIPVQSTHGVDDRIILAGCPLGRAPQLLPFTRRPAGTTEPGQTSGPTAKASVAQPSWTDLLDYYKECVLAENEDTPLLPVADEGKSYVCLRGAERFLSGDLDADACASMPPEAESLVASAAERDAELWAGYPAVVLNGPRTGRPWSAPKFAPLLVRRVEVVHEGGETRLKPYGPVLPHPRLAHDWLGEDDAVDLAETYHPSWHAGQHDRMAVDVRNLLVQEYELPCVQEPRPDQLADRIDVRTPGNGARNVAVLFLAERDTGATKKLLADFDTIAKKAAQIGGTALAALSPHSAERADAPVAEADGPVRLVTPLPSNEAQSAVLRSAMTRRLTVATGPPGTGKSQLVANLVATAIAAGQSVLVASTNNQAVDEVWRRCEELSPGSVIRTGSADYMEVEGKTLRELMVAPAPERNTTTAAVDVDVSARRLNEVRETLAETAGAERTLLLAGRAREEHAARLGRSVRDLLDLLATMDDPAQLEQKAVRLAQARFFGGWRRRRLLGGIGIAFHEGDTVDMCTALADLAGAERAWRSAHGSAAAGLDDAGLGADLDAAESDARAAATALLDNTVRANARSGRSRITNLLTARGSSGSDWAAVRDVLPAARGWAVTSLSARRFPPDPALFDLVIIDEASQCAIPHVLPLLFRARRALVIGDAMQLPHITKVSPEKERVIRQGAGLRADWLERHRLAYRRHAAFHAAEGAAGGTLLLDEHFRCHPDIAEVSNQLFYDGRLIVLTDTRTKPSLERRAVIWAPVKGRAARPPSGVSWVNADEMETVEASVAYLVKQFPEESGATIGVVTPFKAQEEALKRRLRSYGDRVRTGTVHTFQGGERDIMIFSLVAGEGMHRQSIAWVEGQLNLWNVAITRARSHLIVVGDPDLWVGRGGVGAALHRAADASAGTAIQEPDELLTRLYESLSATSSGSASVELGVTVHGHMADAVVRTTASATAVLLDRGPEEGTDPARHLRLMLRRRDLLEGDADAGEKAVRLPAWRLYDAGARSAGHH
ncbi:AAA domain-containing protein [Streptomyces abikoensis]|uniref:caspase, EACC1-associated type n=1 Tax=Streptomyces abikoensis TaxID=97398 RepID=UPI00371D4E98